MHIEAPAHLYMALKDVHAEHPGVTLHALSKALLSLAAESALGQGDLVRAHLAKVHYAR
jgi:hypothetical protein